MGVCGGTGVGGFGTGVSKVADKADKWRNVGGCGSFAKWRVLVSAWHGCSGLPKISRFGG